MRSAHGERCGLWDGWKEWWRLWQEKSRWRGPVVDRAEPLARTFSVGMRGWWHGADGDASSRSHQPQIPVTPPFPRALIGSLAELSVAIPGTPAA